MRKMRILLLAAALAAVLSPTASAAVDLLDGIWGHWAFDDDAGSTTAVNSAWDSPVLDGTFAGTGNAYTTQAMFGGALSLDGNGYVDVTSHVIPDDSAYTWSAWFKNDATSGQRYLVESAGTFAMSGRIDLGTGKYNVYADTSGNDGSVTGVSLPAGFNDDWHLMVVTFQQDDKLKLYVDGAAVAGEDAVTGALMPTTGFHIGADRNAGRTWIGSLDDVGAWRRVLNAEEISYLWNGGAGNAIPVGVPTAPVVDVADGLVANWRFNETGGATADNWVSSTTELDGALQGDAAFAAGGKFGGALALDGDADYVDVANELFPDGQDGFTAATWFHVSELTGLRQMLLETSGSWALSVELKPTTNELGYSIELDGAGVIKGSNVVPTTGAWHHVALSYDAEDDITKIFYDGQELESLRGNPRGDLKPTDGFHIGTYRDADERWFKGLLDDTAVWDRALNDAEIAWLWNDGAGREVASVPEPGGIILLLAGMMCAAAARRREKP